MNADERTDDQLDVLLRRDFTPPNSSELAQLLPATPVRRRWLAYAAGVAAILFVGALLFLRKRELPSTDQAQLPAMFVAAYQDAVSRGFGTSNCCDGDCDLQARCKELFATALKLKDDAGVQLCGAYCGLPAGGAAAMLARAGEEPLCVFVLPHARADNVRTGDFAGLRIHRRDVGALVVFEVSRLPDARVLPHLYVPEG